MTSGFMRLAVAAASEYMGRKIEVFALFLALSLGAGSLLWPILSGGLSFYEWIQIGSLAAAATIFALLPAAYTHRSFLTQGFARHLFAKLAEAYDAFVIAATS